MTQSFSDTKCHEASSSQKELRLAQIKPAPLGPGGTAAAQRRLLAALQLCRAATSGPLLRSSIRGLGREGSGRVEKVREGSRRLGNESGRSRSNASHRLLTPLSPSRQPPSPYRDQSDRLRPFARPSLLPARPPPVLVLSHLPHSYPPFPSLPHPHSRPVLPLHPVSRVGERGSLRLPWGVEPHHPHPR